MNKKPPLPHSLIALLMFVMIAATGTAFARAAQSGGQTVCLGHYALCTHAECTSQPNEKGTVQCSCIQPGPNLNIGNTTCQDRDDPDQPRSTFSLYDLAKIRDKPAMKAFHCTGKYKNRWAFCLDAKCAPTADPATDKSPKKVQCECPLTKKPADFYVLTDNCNQDPETLCSKTWSAASKTELEGGHKQLAKFYAYPAALDYCPEAR